MTNEEHSKPISKGLNSPNKIATIRALYNSKGERYRDLLEEVNQMIDISESSFNHHKTHLENLGIIEKRGEKYVLTEEGEFLARTLEKWYTNFGSPDYSGDIGLELEASYNIEADPIFEPKPLAEKLLNYEFFENIETDTQEFKLRLVHREVDVYILLYEMGVFETNVRTNPNMISGFSEDDFIETNDLLKDFLKSIEKFTEKHVRKASLEAFNYSNVQNETEPRFRKI